MSKQEKLFGEETADSPKVKKLTGNYSEGFERFWKEYPHRPGSSKALAWKYWKRDELEESAEILIGAVRLLKETEWKQTAAKIKDWMPCSAAVFLNQRRYETVDFMAVAKEAARAVSGKKVYTKSELANIANRLGDVLKKKPGAKMPADEEMIAIGCTKMSDSTWSVPRPDVIKMKIDGAPK